MSALPTVSVVIPTYNCGSFLCETIESVLRQTYLPAEIIVVDDGSTDHTQDVLAQIGSPLRVIVQPNLGVSAARNRGIQVARGDLIALLDADDLWLPEKLELQVDLLAREPSLDVAFANYSFLGPYRFDTAFDEFSARMSEISVKASPPNGYLLCSPSLVENFITFGPNPCITSAMVIRRKCFDTAGYFNERYRRPGLEDMQLWIRLAKYCVFGYVDRVLMKRRHVQKYSSQDELDRIMFSETIEMFEDMDKWIPLSVAERQALVRRLAEIYFAAGYFEFSKCLLRPAREYFKSSLRYWFRRKPLYYFGLSYLPSSCLRQLRAAKQRIGPIVGGLKVKM